MTINVKGRDAAINLLRGVAYFEDLLSWHDSIPHARISAFCERQDAPLGASRIFFLITRAEELEAQVAKAAEKGMKQ